MSTYDAIIVGGGPTGLVVAAGLAQAGQRVAVVEPRPPRISQTETEFDLRVSTFSPASLAILDAVGARAHVPEDRAFRFEAMSVWEDDPGRTLEFHAADAGLPDLGAVIENERVRVALWQVVQDQCEVVEASVDRIDLDGDPRVIADGAKLKGRVLVGADGARSAVRDAAGIDVKRHEYFQSGVVGVIRTEEPHGGVARQRFLPTGPLALLPLDAHHVSIVWTLPTALAHRMASVDEEEFRSRLQSASQGVLGTLEPEGMRAAFPLRRQHAAQYQARRCVLVGDAAHQVHPLAGQGANLGLLDAAALVEEMTGDASLPIALRRYERRRRSDAWLMTTGIHALGEVYRWPGAAGELRRLGTDIVSALPGLSSFFVTQASGLGGRVPRMARSALPGIG